MSGKRKNTPEDKDSASDGSSRPGSSMNSDRKSPEGNDPSHQPDFIDSPKIASDLIFLDLLARIIEVHTPQSSSTPGGQRENSTSETSKDKMSECAPPETPEENETQENHVPEDESESEDAEEEEEEVDDEDENEEEEGDDEEEDEGGEEEGEGEEGEEEEEEEGEEEEEEEEEEEDEDEEGYEEEYEGGEVEEVLEEDEISRIASTDEKSDEEDDYNNDHNNFGVDSDSVSDQFSPTDSDCEPSNDLEDEGTYGPNTGDNYEDPNAGWRDEMPATDISEDETPPQWFRPEINVPPYNCDDFNYEWFQEDEISDDETPPQWFRPERDEDDSTGEIVLVASIADNWTLHFLVLLFVFLDMYFTVYWLFFLEIHEEQDEPFEEIVLLVSIPENWIFPSYQIVFIHLEAAEGYWFFLCK